MPKIKGLLALIVKDEKDNILEWICHHTLVGFERIVIYDNQSSDGTDEIIKEASKFFPVDYILWRDDMEPVPGLTKQGAAYTDCIKKYGALTSWMCFLDGDEFLVPPGDEKLETLLERMCNERSFAINWMTFGSSSLESSHGRLVTEAFTQRAEATANVNRHVKMFFKPEFAVRVVNPHYIDVGQPAVDLQKKPIRWSSDGIVLPDEIRHLDWRVHHYIIRSREHWRRRVKRKQPGGQAREWSTFREYDKNDVSDYYAYPSARRVRQRLLELGHTYAPVPDAPAVQVPSVSSGRETNIICFIDELSSFCLRGWAYDPEVEEPISLNVFVDDVLLSRTLCDISRNDVKNSKVGKENVGFFLRLPRDVLDGNRRNISITDTRGRPVKFYMKGKRFERYFFAETFAPEIIGQVDEPQNAALRGWVAVARDVERQHFETGCHVLVCLGNRPVGSVIADLPRPDVAAAHGISARCGFIFPVPGELRDGTLQTFRIFVLPEKVELKGSPISIDFGLQDNAGRTVHLAALIDKISRNLERTNGSNDELSEAAREASELVEKIIPRRRLNIVNYAPWFHHHYQDILHKLKKEKLKYSPLVSVVCPVYRPALKDFRIAMRSVLDQTYANLELILCDDGGRDIEIIKEIKNLAKSDQRIKFIINDDNEGISEATNKCLNLANGDWILFFDHDDVLVNCAIERMLSYNQHINADIIYSDEDKIDEFGSLSEPMFKPDWNYRYLLGVNYLNHLTMIRRALLQRVGGLRSEFNGAQDHDLLLRCIEYITPESIVHVPEVLYHWRKTESSTASSIGAKTYAIEAGIKAVSEHLQRRGIEAVVSSHGQNTFYRVQVETLSGPAISIIIPFRDQMHFTKRCVDSILKFTNKHNIEIILVDNNSQTKEAKDFLDNISELRNIKIIKYKYKFNYSRINNIAASHAKGEYIVFMNNDLFVMDELWLDVMLAEMIIDPQVAAVGGKFLYQNRTIQHCGVVVGFGGVAGHAFTHESEYYPGYGVRALLAHEVSAVTAACMLVRKDVFKKVGGFDEKNLKIAFNDIDLCLKIRSAGYKIVVAPEFIAEHHESISRGLEDSPEKVARFKRETKTMQRRWKDELKRDPFYSPSFDLDGKPYFDLLPPPRSSISSAKKDEN